MESTKEAALLPLIGSMVHDSTQGQLLHGSWHFPEATSGVLSEDLVAKS